MGEVSRPSLRRKRLTSSLRAVWGFCRINRVRARLCMDGLMLIPVLPCPYLRMGEVS